MKSKPRYSLPRYRFLDFYKPKLRYQLPQFPCNRNHGARPSIPRDVSKSILDGHAKEVHYPSSPYPTNPYPSFLPLLPFTRYLSPYYITPPPYFPSFSLSPLSSPPIPIIGGSEAHYPPLLRPYLRRLHPQQPAVCSTAQSQ